MAITRSSVVAIFLCSKLQHGAVTAYRHGRFSAQSLIATCATIAIEATETAHHAVFKAIDVPGYLFASFGASTRQSGIDRACKQARRALVSCFLCCIALICGIRDSPMSSNSSLVQSGDANSFL